MRRNSFLLCKDLLKGLSFFFSLLATPFPILLESMGWWMGWEGTLASPCRGGKACTGLGRGRRKRPLPTSTPLPPTRVGILWLRIGGPFVPVGAGVVDGVGGDACVAL